MFRSMLLVAATWLAPFVAHAQVIEPPLRATLDWSAPDGCGTSASVTRGVSEQLGRRAFVDDAPELRVHARIEHLDHFVATVDLDTATGESVGHRVVESRSQDCDAITESVIVVLGVLLNVDRADLALPAPAPSALEATLVATGGVEIGLLPRVGGEAIVGFALGARGVLDVGLELGWIGTSAVAVGSGAWLVQAATARLVVALPLTRGDVELAARLACGGGAMWATVSGLDTDRTLAASPLLEIRAGLRLLLHLVDRLWLSVTADVDLLPLGGDFRVQDAGGAVLAEHVPPIAVGSFGVGPCVRFE